MTVSRTVTEQIQRASWIRRMFEEGACLKAERGVENVFDFTLGNPDLDPPDGLLANLQKIAAENPAGAHSYMPNPGFPEVRRRLAEYLARQTDLPYTSEHVLMTVGAAGALNVILKAILDPGDEVILLVPYFAEYQFYVTNHGGRLVFVNTDEQCRPDLDSIAAAITDRTRAIIVNSPNNPSGAIYTEEFYRGLEKLLNAQPQPITVLTDEPYKSLAFYGIRPPEIAPLVTRTITTTSWSKALGLAGERIGYLAISPRIPDAAAIFGACAFTNRILGFVNAPALWQRVIVESLDFSVDVSIYQSRCELMWEGLTRMGYQVIKPQGGFYLFVKTPIPDDVAFVQLLKEENVLVVPGTGFGRPGYVRISATVPKATIERSFTGFQHALYKTRD